jgi:hypothetical protein
MALLAAGAVPAIVRHVQQQAKDAQRAEEALVTLCSVIGGNRCAIRQCYAVLCVLGHGSFCSTRYAA